MATLAPKDCHLQEWRLVRDTYRGLVHQYAVDFGICDQKGRKIGAILDVCEELSATGNHRVLVSRILSTRDGKRFRPLTTGVIHAVSSTLPAVKKQLLRRAEDSKWDQARKFAAKEQLND